jgi:AcrR family transcriptional regulator
MGEIRLTDIAGRLEVPELRVDARRNQRRILRAAARLLADDPAVSIQRIADEAEVARPTVYRRYPTKEALVQAILAEALDEFASALHDASSSPRDAATVLAQLIAALAQIGANYPVLLLSEAPYAPHGAHGVDIPEELDALITRGQQERTIRSDLYPSVLRHSLFGSLAVSLRGARHGDLPLTTAQIAKQVAALLIEGARPR